MVARHRLPGVPLVEPSRLRPRLHYELLVCGLAGHALIGVDARHLSEDTLLAREVDGVRWHRCLRCDSWLPVQPPATPTRELPPARAEIQLPRRGKPLRDTIVLRLIAVNRALHFLVLGLLAVVIFTFASHREELRGRFFRVLADLQTGASADRPGSGHGLLHDIERAFSALKVLTIVINLAVVAYLLWAKRLFGLRGGVAAEHREREQDVGWAALERSAPEVVGAPAAS
jgi:hypothetical protein